MNEPNGTIPASSLRRRLDANLLRRAFGQFATGVAVIGAGVNEARGRHDSQVDHVRPGSGEAGGERGAQHLARTTRVAAQQHTPAVGGQPVPHRPPQGER